MNEASSLPSPQNSNSINSNVVINDTTNTQTNDVTNGISNEESNEVNEVEINNIAK